MDLGHNIGPAEYLWYWKESCYSSYSSATTLALQNGQKKDFTAIPPGYIV